MWAACMCCMCSRCVDIIIGSTAVVLLLLVLLFAFLLSGITFWTMAKWFQWWRWWCLWYTSARLRVCTYFRFFFFLYFSIAVYCIMFAFLTDFFLLYSSQFYFCYLSFLSSKLTQNFLFLVCSVFKPIEKKKKMCFSLCLTWSFFSSYIFECRIFTQHS